MMKRMGLGFLAGAFLGALVSNIMMDTPLIGSVVGGFAGLAIAYLKERVEN